MSFARNLVRRMFGQSIEVLGLEIAFHKKANLYGTHGILMASHRDQKLDNYQVRFCFVGLSEAPAMTPVIMNYIWEEAKAQGYIPHKLLSYGHVLETTPEAAAKVPQVGAVPEAIRVIAHAQEQATMTRQKSDSKQSPAVQAEVDNMVAGIAAAAPAPAVWRGAHKTEPQLENATS